MYISFDTADELTDVDRRVLRALLGEDAQSRTQEVAVAGEGDPSSAGAERAEVAAEQAEEAKPARRKRRTKAEIEADKKAKEAAEKAAEEADEDEAEDEADEPAKPAAAPSSGVTMQDVVSRATELAASGKRPAVKAALDAVGGERVGALKADQLDAFMAALDEALEGDDLL